MKLKSDVNDNELLRLMLTGDEEALAAASDEGAEDILPLITERAQFCARVDARTHAKPGERVRLAVDPSRLHFFEPDTGLAISSERTVPATA